MKYSLTTSRFPICEFVGSVRVHTITAEDDEAPLQITQELSLTTARNSANIHVGWIAVPISRHQAARTLRDVRKEMRK